MSKRNRRLSPTGRDTSRDQPAMQSINHHTQEYSAVKAAFLDGQKGVDLPVPVAPPVIETHQEPPIVVEIEQIRNTEPLPEIVIDRPALIDRLTNLRNRAVLARSFSDVRLLAEIQIGVLDILIEMETDN